MTSQSQPRPASADLESRGARSSGWRRALAALTAIALAVSGVLLTATPASADPVTGEVHGSVAVTNVPFVMAGVGEVRVTLWRVIPGDGGSVPNTAVKVGNFLTDADGEWSAGSGLPLGQYALEYEYLGDAPGVVADSFHNGTAFSIGEALLNTGEFLYIGEAEFSGYTTLNQGVTLHGTVTDGAWAPLSGQPVQIWRHAPLQGGSVWQLEDATTTDAVGAYSFSRLPVGRYTIRAGGAKGYVAEFYNDVESADPNEAAYLEFSAWGIDSQWDIMLSKGSAISGTVKDASGKGISGITVIAAVRNDWTVGPDLLSTTTGPTGAYTLPPLPAASYLLRFESPDLAAKPYLTEYWKDATYWGEATPVTVNGTTTKTGINATLTKGATISGTITLAGGGAPAADDLELSACRFYPGDDYAECDEQADVDYDPTTGAYKLLGLLAGSYTVRVEYDGPGNFRDEYFSNAYSQATATRFSLATGATASGKNIVLEAGGWLSGDVTYAGSPVVGAQLAAYPARGHRADMSDDPAFAVTDENGHYEFLGLPPGPVAVYASPPTDLGLAAEWYLNSTRPGQITPVVLATGVEGSADFVLQQANGIGGTVTAASGGGVLDSATVDLYRFVDLTSTTTEYVGSTSVDEFGHYQFTNLSPGAYTVSAWAFGGYLESWAGLEPGRSAGNATRRTLSVPGDAQTINVALRRGASVTGQLMAGGEPVTSGEVGVFCASSDGPWGAEPHGDGSFTVQGIVPDPDCTLQVQTYDPQLVARTLVDLPSSLALDAATIDLGVLQIAAGSDVSGVITGRGGKPVADAVVFAYTLDDAGLPTSTGAYTQADSLGRYVIDGLPVGPIYLQFAAYGYPVQFLGGDPEWSLADVVTVATPGSAITRDVRLFDGGRVTGKVTNKATGKGIAGIEVEVSQIWPAGSDLSFGTETNSSGAYSIPGLPSGSYRVEVNSSACCGDTGAGYTSTSKIISLPSKAVATVNASISRTYKVSGIVRDSSSEPQGDVRVEALKLVNGHYVLAEADSAFDWTDNFGAYELRLEPGTWILRFTDERDRSAITYYGGGQSQAGATKLKVSTSALTGKNVTLPQLTGGVDATFLTPWGEVPAGTVRVSRIEDGEVVSSRFVGGEGHLLINDLFPITDLAAGHYRLEFWGWTSGGAYGILLPDYTTEFDVEEGVVTHLGVIQIAEFFPYPPDFPEPVPGQEPEIIAGDVKVDALLSVDEGVWNDDPTEYFYQWLRDGQVIPGATEADYLLRPGDAGHHIRLAIGVNTPTFWADSPWFFITDETAEVGLGDAPVAATPPTVTGTAKVGQTLKANPGTWNLEGVKFSYRWIRYDASPTDTVLSTAASYTLKPADLWDAVNDRQLVLEVTATRAGYAPGVAELAIDQVVLGGLTQTTKGKVTTVGDEYTVTAGTWSPGATSYGYAWIIYHSDGNTTASVDDQTGSSASFTDSGDERLVVQITAYRNGYRPTTVTVPVRSGPQIEITGTLALTSTPPQLGVPVSVDFSGASINISTMNTAYQWYRNGVAITGAKSWSYTPSTTDVGKTLSVKLVGSATGYPSSAKVTVVASGATLPGGVIVPDTVTIAGTPVVGRTLTAVRGTWAPVPTTWSYQWKRDGVNITDATGSSYRLGSKDLGRQLTVTVKGKRSGFTTVTVTSDPTPVIATLAIQSVSSPTIPWSARVGSKLSLTGKGTWDLTPSAYAYQWTVNGAAIPGATGTSYVPTPSDLGFELCVLVTAKRSGYANSEPTCSNRVTVEPGLAVAATAKPTVKVGGVAVTTTTLGSTITTNGGSWPVSGLSLRYTWQQDPGDGNWVDLDETGSTLVLDDPGFEVGDRFRVVVTAVRSGYLPSPSTTSGGVLISG